MTELDSNDELNWVDPDIIAYCEGTHAPDYDPVLERDFKEFFITGWLDPKYDPLREHWDPLINDESPHARVLAKTALWSCVQVFDNYRRLETKKQEVDDELGHAS